MRAEYGTAFGKARKTHLAIDTQMNYKGTLTHT